MTDGGYYPVQLFTDIGNHETSDQAILRRQGVHCSQKASDLENIREQNKKLSRDNYQSPQDISATVPLGMSCASNAVGIAS